SLSSETRRYHDQAGRLLDSMREMKDSIVVNLVCIHVPIDALTLDGIDLDTPLPQAVMKWKTLVRMRLTLVGMKPHSGVCLVIGQGVHIVKLVKHT
ncbi:hypothetical protein Tco_0198517, partial [Tanacetum coccineum]